tara:strand:- start:4488 stop:4757 length:270 start_codon:yes stop_codon:yes gene_type:complete
MKNKKLPDRFDVQWKREVPKKGYPNFEYIKCGHSPAEAFRQFRKQKRKGKEDIVIVRYSCEAVQMPMFGWCPVLEVIGHNYSGNPGDWK